jgi:hypothetical protein
VNSTTVNIADNIIQLNGTGATNAGLVVRDATASTLTSGSLLWDTTNDYWIAGPLGSEAPLVTTTGTQTLTNKTINGSQLVDASVANAKLTNSSITISNGTGVSGGGSVALGGSLTLSIGQAVATNSNVQFNALGVGTAAPATAGLIRATNDVIAFYGSDSRLKENVTPISNPIEKLNQIGGYEYDWIPMEGVHENEGHDIGVIAQEIEAILPEIVTTRENGYKAVKYERLVALLIECVKDQQKQIDELKNKL